MKRFLAAVLIAAAVSGCATSTGPVPIGKDTYMIAIGGKSMASGGELKARAFKEANAFCLSKGRQLVPINSNQRDMSFGQDPTAEIQFACLAPTDPLAQQPAVMQSNPNTVIELRNK